MDPLAITDKELLLEMLEKRRQGNARIIDEKAMATSLRKRVRGQDHILDDLSRFIRLQWGKERRGKPIASLLFVGPPATGKTELQKLWLSTYSMTKSTCCVSTAASSLVPRERLD